MNAQKLNDVQKSDLRSQLYSKQVKYDSEESVKLAIKQILIYLIFLTAATVGRYKMFLNSIT